MMIEQFRNTVYDKLEDLSIKQKVYFAWLCAVRATPFLGLQERFEYWNVENRRQYLSSIFNALDLVASLESINIEFARHEADMHYASSFARKAMDCAADAQSGGDVVDDIPSLRFVYDSVYATVYAADAADYATFGTTDRRSKKSLGKLKASVGFAASSAYSASLDKETMKKILLSDLDAIGKNQRKIHNKDTSIYGEAWQVFLNGLAEHGFERRAKYFESLFKNDFQAVYNE